MTWGEEAMEIRSVGSQVRFDKIPRTRIKVWFFSICSSILLWTCLFQLVAVGELWRPPFITDFSSRFLRVSQSPPLRVRTAVLPPPPSPPPPPPPPPRNYTSNGFLKVTCNGGLNQMRAAICDMVTVARLLNLTLVVPELDKTSFWADTRYFIIAQVLIGVQSFFKWPPSDAETYVSSGSDFDDIFDVSHFINSLRDEVRIIKRLPKRFSRKYGFQPLVMQPVSWSNENYYLQQVLPLFSKHNVIHFNKTDARLANNGLPLDIQKLRCRVNTQALKFNSKIEALGNKLVHILKEKGHFIALHLRYEMDMLAFSGCTHGCTDEEAEELKRMRYAFPWWREKEINSKEKRSEGLCPLTPEEASMVLQALGLDNNTHIYIAAGEIYGSERRLKALREAFPHTMKKEMLLDPDDLWHFRNHSSQMAALDYMVAVASDIFVPTYDGNMAKVVEGHRRHLGFKTTLLLNRKRIVELIDLHQNGTLSWDSFVVAVKEAHVNRTGQPVPRKIIPEKPKEEDYFYANPQECFCENTNCSTHNSSTSQ